VGVSSHRVVQELLLPSFIDEENEIEEDDCDQYPHDDDIQAKEFHNLHDCFLSDNCPGGRGLYATPLSLLIDTDDKPRGFTPDNNNSLSGVPRGRTARGIGS
jgi:hypothetical protein